MKTKFSQSGLLLVFVLLVPPSFFALIAIVPSTELPASDAVTGSVYPASPLRFTAATVGEPAIGHPRICNVGIGMHENSGNADILVCDAGRNTVSIIQYTDGDWQEKIIGTDLLAPAHATFVDIDQDGDLDVVVAVLGNIEPDDSVIGRIVVLENQAGIYTPRTILEDVRRVADVQPGDFDSDGDIDLAVAVFGYNRGQVLWLENHGNFQFEEHELLSAPGVIHVPVADYDGDGDLDIAAVVSQDEEELWGFENIGDGQFIARRLWWTVNFDLGSAGLIQTDLDGDGDIDLLLPVGDNLEDFDPFPQPYHGCLWFENLGQWNFRMHRIANLGGTYAAAVGDLDGDGDLDVVLASMANVWDQPNRASLIWLENDGHQNFRPWQIASEPTHLVTVAIGDLNGDGRNDIVAGGLHIRGPYDRIGRVTAWLNSAEAQP